MKDNKNIKAKEKGKPDALIIVFSICAAAAVIFMAVALIFYFSAARNNAGSGETAQETAEFVPPSFDENAVSGTPDIANPEEKGYLEVYREGMSFNAFLCCELEITDSKADIYFTNPQKNSLWMKLRIFDENGSVIAETGLIKPNEYLKTVEFTSLPKDGSEITVKIMTYEPNTYFSGGAVPVKISGVKVSS